MNTSTLILKLLEYLRLISTPYVESEYIITNFLSTKMTEFLSQDPLVKKELMDAIEFRDSIECCSLENSKYAAAQLKPSKLISNILEIVVQSIDVNEFTIEKRKDFVKQYHLNNYELTPWFSTIYNKVQQTRPLLRMRVHKNIKDSNS